MPMTSRDFSQAIMRTPISRASSIIPSSEVTSLPVTSRLISYFVGKTYDTLVTSGRPRFAIMVMLAISIFYTGCPKYTTISGPMRPDTSLVTSVRVTELVPTSLELSTISDHSRVLSIVESGAFSDRGWIAAVNRNLIPGYRLDLLKGETVTAVYFLGTNSYPPEFPCYWFCSGWWLGASTNTGQFDRDRYKPLTESVYLPLVRALELGGSKSAETGAGP